MRKRIRTTAEQREALKMLRARLAEHSYDIYPVAPWYRRHGLDFLALPKIAPRELILIRPARDGSISVRPYLYGSLYHEARTWLSRLQADCPIRWSTRQLPFAKKRSEWWYSYLPASAQKEFGYLNQDF